MAKKKKKKNSISNEIADTLGSYWTTSEPARRDSSAPSAATEMSSQRSRNARGPGRGNGNSSQGEEVQLWNQCKEELRNIVDLVNGSNDNTRAIIAQDKYMAGNKGSYDTEAEYAKLESLLRGEIRHGEITKPAIDQLIDQLMILRAVQKSKEDSEAQAAGVAGPSRPAALAATGRTASMRGAGAREREREQREREREKEREQKEKDKEKDKDKEKERDKDPASLYDFDGAGDSPLASPISGHTRKLGSGGAGSDLSGNRESVPPRGGDRDTPAKGDSVPPESLPGSSSSTAAAALLRSKVNFIKGQDVVFKPKPSTNSENQDWFLGRVVQVLGEGKSRRYKVQDADPDVPPGERIEYRTSASNMIPLPAEGAEMSELDKGKTVLALYPDSTTFYKAEVTGMDMETMKVNLRFEGEENSGTTQVVDRRFVVEYRN